MCIGCFCNCCGCLKENQDIITAEFEGSNAQICFLVNARSGGQKGAAIIQWAEEQSYMAYDLLFLTRVSEESDKILLEINDLITKKEDRIIFIVAGGDGTISWALTIIDTIILGRDFEMWDEINKDQLRQTYLTKIMVRIIPLGTGNDVSGVLGCGNDFPGMSYLPQIVQECENNLLRYTFLDCWSVRHIAKENNPENKITPWLSNRFVAYFSVGGSAQLAHKFHEKRENNPGRYNARWKNQIGWAAAGAGKVFSSETKLKKLCDFSEGEESVIPPESAKDILICNVNSIAGGVNLWGTSSYINKKQKRSHLPCTGDGMLEVFSGTGTSCFSNAYFNMVSFTRVAQVGSLQIHLNEPQCVQIDGEAWQEESGTVSIDHHVAVRFVLGSSAVRNVLYEDSFIQTKYLALERGGFKEHILNEVASDDLAESSVIELLEENHLSKQSLEETLILDDSSV